MAGGLGVHLEVYSWKQGTVSTCKHQLQLQGSTDRPLRPSDSPEGTSRSLALQATLAQEEHMGTAATGLHLRPTRWIAHVPTSATRSAASVAQGHTLNQDWSLEGTPSPSGQGKVPTSHPTALGQGPRFSQHHSWVPCVFQHGA